MDALWIPEQGGAEPFDPARHRDARGFLWLDVEADDWQADPDTQRGEVERLTGIRLHDLHLQDAGNAAHPSYFDNTASYEMLVFRRLLTPADMTPPPAATADRTRRVPLLPAVESRPVTFFLLPTALLTVRHGSSRTCDTMKQRLRAAGVRPAPDAPADGTSAERPQGGNGEASLAIRPPAGPAELMLRLLTGMIDRYLALRQPMTHHLDRWQRELLSPNRRFNNWLSLLDARAVLHRLENICEEQYDALSSLRDVAADRSEDAWGSGAFGARRDALLVRLNDALEHVNRTLLHARRLEASVETAVQLHFSATAHRTNEIMRILTVVTVIFMPLTLITGVFGMNVDRLPLVHRPEAFWWIMIGMGCLAAGLWLWFSARRYIETRPYRMAEKLARKATGRDDAR